MILAIDLGGTKIQYAVLEYATDLGIESQPGCAESITTEATQKDFLRQLKKIVASQIRDLSNAPTEKRIQCIAIGVPGPTVNNVMQGSRPLNVRENFDFSEILADFALPLVVKNDLNMAAYCELYCGAGLSHKNFCLLSLSTGIGLSAINNGHILQGRIEMGHQVFNPDFEPAQACTNHNNCWASLASGSGIENRFSDRENTTAESIFRNVLTPQNIAQLQTINAQALGSIICAYDPEVIVVMGSLGIKQFNRLLPRRQEIERYTINRPIPALVKTQYEDEIGILGAYYAGLEHLSSKHGN